MNADITYFAQTNFRNKKHLFGIRQADRQYHTYVIGKTGAGKTNLLKTQIFQDIEHNRGLCFFDIHGDLIKEMLHPNHPSLSTLRYYFVSNLTKSLSVLF